MIRILPLALCCGVAQAGLQGCDNPEQEQGVMHLGSLVSQTAASRDQDQMCPSTLIRARVHT